MHHPPETPHEETCPHQQNEGKHRLGGEEPGAEPGAGRGAVGGSAPERRGEGGGGAAGLDRRREAGEKRRGDGREQSRGGDPRVERAVHPAHVGQHGRSQEVAPPPRNEEGDTTAARGEERALREELAHQPPAPHAQGQSHGDLPPAARRAGQEEVRHVGADDEEHHQRDAG